MELRAQDIYVALKLVVLRNKPQSMQGIGESIGMSASRVHDAMHRLMRARLALRDGCYRPVAANLMEFLAHGIRFAFVPDIGGPTRGIPTAAFAPPLDRKLMVSNDPPYVWPHPEGKVRGIAFSPLHKSAPVAAQRDPDFYELLALVDAVRGGRARERTMAIEELNKRILSHAAE